MIAAAIADPLVEGASNSGWFGHARLTDGSNLDVVPAFAIGLGLLVLYLVGKARLIVVGRMLPRRFTAMLPAIFVLQIATLYAMETSEQFIVYGHALGPMIWLGGPLLAGLAIHGAVCIAVTLVLARSLRALAATTLHVIRLLRALATLAAHSGELVTRGYLFIAPFSTLAPARCGIGERAPPPAT